MRTSKHYNLILKNFILPISIGTFIYLLFRPLHITVFHWANTLGIYCTIIEARTFYDIGHLIPEWAIYSLPNGLWAYSFMFFISFIWGEIKSSSKAFFIALVVLLSLGSEIGQLFSLVPGSFCLTDIFLYSLGLLIGYYSGQYYFKGGYEQ